MLAGLQSCKKKRCKDDANCEQAFSNVQLRMHIDRKYRGEQTCGQRGGGLNRSASVYQPLPSPSLFSHSPFSKLLGWLHCVETSLPTYTHYLSPLPTSSSCLISMQQARWYSNSVLCYDLINEIWLPAWILETGMAFWNSEDGRVGRRGSWEARDAWRAEVESCQLGSGNPVSL